VHSWTGFEPYLGLLVLVPGQLLSHHATMSIAWFARTRHAHLRCARLYLACLLSPRCPTHLPTLPDAYATATLPANLLSLLRKCLFSSPYRENVNAPRASRAVGSNRRFGQTLAQHAYLSANKRPALNMAESDALLTRAAFCAYMNLWVSLLRIVHLSGRLERATLRITALSRTSGGAQHHALLCSTSIRSAYLHRCRSYSLRSAANCHTTIMRGEHCLRNRAMPYRCALTRTYRC